MQLALETSTNICSVAFKDTKGEMHEKRTEVKGSHSEQLFLFIEELMKEHRFTIEELDSVLVSQGPGSYTGLRISASAVKGLLFQSEVRFYAANTLASFAVSALEVDLEATTIHSVIDARRVHVYHQQFDYSSGVLTSDDQVKVIPIEQFQKTIEPGDIVIGTGLKRLDQGVLKQATTFDSSHISARSLLRLLAIDIERQFIHEADPQQFDPKYYSFSQV